MVLLQERLDHRQGVQPQVVKELVVREAFPRDDAVFLAVDVDDALRALLHHLVADLLDQPVIGEPGFRTLAFRRRLTLDVAGNELQQVADGVDGPGVGGE